MSPRANNRRQQHRVLSVAEETNDLDDILSRSVFYFEFLLISGYNYVEVV